MDRTGPNAIHEAEVLAVSGGIDEATGRPTARRVGQAVGEPPRGVGQNSPDGRMPST